MFGNYKLCMNLWCHLCSSCLSTTQIGVVLLTVICISLSHFSYPLYLFSSQVILPELLLMLPFLIIFSFWICTKSWLKEGSSLLWCCSKSVGKLLPMFLGSIPEDSNLQRHCCEDLKSHTSGWNIANHRYSFHDVSQIYLVCSIFLCTECEYTYVTHFCEHFWTCS